MDKMEEYRQKLQRLNEEYGVEICLIDDTGRSIDARFDVYLQKQFEGVWVNINEEWKTIDGDGIRVL